MKSKFIFLVLILLVVPSVKGFDLMWTQTIDMKQSNIMPIAHDVNGDGKMEIFFADSAGVSIGRVACVSHSGEILWELSPTPYGIPNHRPLELHKVDGVWMLFLAVPGGAFALNAATGEEIWRNPTAKGMEAHHLVMDIDGQAFFYVTRNDANNVNGRIYKLDAKTGTILKEVHMHYSCHGGISGADFNNHGDFRLVVTDRNYGGGLGVRCYDARTLELLWYRSNIACSSHCASLIDVNKDGYLDVIVAHQSDPAGLFILDGRNGEYIKHQTSIPNFKVHESFVASEFNGNIMVMSCSWNPITVWNVDTWEREATLVTAGFPPFLANVLGDERLEIIVTHYGANYKGYIYDSEYNLVKEILPPSGQRVRSGLVNDFDGDGTNELLIITTGFEESASPITLQCYKTEGKASNYHTTSARMNNLRTGAPIESQLDVPGFELVVLLFAIVLVLYFRRK